MRQRLIFRVDANSEIGYGHLVRCTSISTEFLDFQKEIHSTEELSSFVMKQDDKSLFFKKLVNSDSFFAEIGPNDIVIIDGYQFDSNYQQNIMDTGAHLIVIDDLANQLIYADVVINPNPLIQPLDFSALPSTQFCTGLNYALLRPAFIDLLKTPRTRKIENSLLICFGGSDPLNQTEVALTIVLSSSINFSDIHVVLGPGFQENEAIHQIAARNSKVQVHNELQAADMAMLMAKTEFAIVPCSSILLETLAAEMKILSGYYVENQKYVYQYYLDQGWFVDAKNFKESEILHALSILKSKTICIDVIDGKSMERIRKIVLQLALEKESTLRKATLKDMKTTFEWANSSETRQFALNKDDILWENHQSWFASKISSENCWYGIVEQGGTSRGSIRFDISNGIALISYLVEPSSYGKGFGTILMKMGIEGMLKEFKTIQEIHGVVFAENIASMKTFKRFGFEQSISEGIPLFIKKIEQYV